MTDDMSEGLLVPTWSWCSIFIIEHRLPAAYAVVGVASTWLPPRVRICGLSCPQPRGIHRCEQARKSSAMMSETCYGAFGSPQPDITAQNMLYGWRSGHLCYRCRPGLHNIFCTGQDPWQLLLGQHASSQRQHGFADIKSERKLYAPAVANICKGK